MINALLKGIMGLIMGLVNVLMAPIDLLISAALPDLSAGISAVGNMFQLVGNSLGFAVSVTGLSSETLSLIALYYTFKLTVPFTIYAIKTAIKWYNALKP